MTRFSFDLLEQPWIPVLHPDGVTAETLGLRALFHRAHELRAVFGESPLVTAALYRLLLALTFAIHGEPQGTRQWAHLWRLRRFDPAAVDAYFERWRERFDLFHPERPFFQWPEKASREKQAIDLFPDFASGGNATLFDHHHTTDQTAFLPDQAARALLLVMAFSVSGGNGMAPRESSDAPWARGAVFLAEGDTVFETLMLNYLPTGISHGAEDRPFWEAEAPFAPQRETPLGMCDYLTWPIRAIHLLPEQRDGQTVVQKVCMGTGLKLAEITHPVYAYSQQASDGKMLFQRFHENRALWRDSTTFLQLKSDKIRPPAVLHWLAELIEDELLPRHQRFRLMALGMSNNQAKVDFYREEHFPLPGEYLEQPGLVETLGQALEKAEAARSALGRSLSRMAALLLSPTADDKNGRKPDPKDVNNLLGHWAADRLYWAALEPAFFTLLLDLPADPSAAHAAWDEALRTAARQTFERTARMAGESTRALRAVARAENQLYGSLKKVFEPTMQKE
ncbi:MAG: type I-E CRISPR-associated protein Cse1/CasA [Anaerolineales bacterium]